jgi:hypothetical protein
VTECRHLGEQCRLDVLSGDEQLDRLMAALAGRLDQVLPLRDEQPEFVPPAAVVQLANELELLVLAGGDQGR